MRSFSLALTALLAATSVSAGFSNTHELLAFSDEPSANLESFRPWAGKASQAKQLEKAANAGEPCMPALIVSAPSFSHADVGLLPSSSAIRREWERAQSVGGQTMHLPYFQGPSVENLKSMISRRLGHCETPVVFKAFKKQGGKGTKSAWINDLDRMVEYNLDQLPASSRIVILSSAPDLGSHYRQKRQITDDEWESMVQDEFSGLETDPATGIQVDEVASRPSSVFAEGYTPSVQQDNSTVNPNAGLLFHYTFTSPALIFGSIIVLLILVPAVLLSVNALTSIELVRGLETKMQGGQLGETKKDQ